MIYLVGYDEKKVGSYIHKLNREIQNSLSNRDYGVSIGYSMINNEQTTIDDAINDSLMMIRKSKGVKMKNKIKEFEKLIFAREMSILPGNLAFSFFMAVIPMLTLIFYFCTQFHLPMDVINNFLAKTFPKGVVDLLQPVFTSSISMDSVVTLVVGFTVAVNGCNAIIIASNTIYGFDNSSFLRRMIKAVFLAVCVVLLFAFIVIVQVLGNAIIALIDSFTSIIADNKIIVDTLYFILRVPVSLLVVYFFIKTVYAIAPDEKYQVNI